MSNEEGLVKISRKSLNQILREVKKDGFIISNKRGFFGRFIKNNARFDEATDAFSFPFIGCFRGNAAFIKPSILSHYVQNKIN